MPSQAMQDVIDALRDRQKANAREAPPTLEERRAAFVPGDRLHPVPDDVLVQVTAGGCQPTGLPPRERTPAGVRPCTAEVTSSGRFAATASWPPGLGGPAVCRCCSLNIVWR